jgi:hypothetical protein
MLQDHDVPDKTTCLEKSGRLIVQTETSRFGTNQFDETISEPQHLTGSPHGARQLGFVGNGATFFCKGDPTNGVASVLVVKGASFPRETPLLF